jgi:serine/threonine protein kinase
LDYQVELFSDDTDDEPLPPDSSTTSIRRESQSSEARAVLRTVYGALSTKVWAAKKATVRRAEKSMGGMILDAKARKARDCLFLGDSEDDRKARDCLAAEDLVSTIFGWFFGGAPAGPEPWRARRPELADGVEYGLEALEVLGLIGRGAFGNVSLVRCGVTGQLLALKEVSKGMLVESQMQESLELEKEVMQAVDSPFIPKLAATFNSAQSVYFLLEAAMGGNLDQVYMTEGFFGSQPHARFYTACVTCALEHLHSRFILHRDLKMENVVLNSRGYAMLCDFGTANFAANYRNYTTYGTPEYMAPEVIDGIGHRFGADWWSLGILVYELNTGETPFQAEDTLAILEKITSKDALASVPLPDATWAGLVRGLLQAHPEKRLPMQNGGIKNLKEHDWFAEVEGGGASWWEALARLELTSPFVPTLASPEDLSSLSAEDLDPPMRQTFLLWDEDPFCRFEDKMGPRIVSLE